MVVRVTGGSMAPGIPRGALVRVEPGIEGVAAGDVVLFRSGEAFVLHRVLHRFRSRKETFVVECGDVGGPPRIRPGGEVEGRAVAVLEPEGLRVPAASGGRWRSRRALAVVFAVLWRARRAVPGLSPAVAATARRLYWRATRGLWAGGVS